MSEISGGYIEHGWALCQFAKGTKGGELMGKGWNSLSRAIRSVEQIKPDCNVGLLHAWSRTCAIDADDYARGREWMANAGIDIDTLLLADDAVQIRSGRENRAKLLFRVPDHVDPLTLLTVAVKATDPDATGRHQVLVEFRCAAAGGVSVQDVLPPSIHPDTGKPYTWGGAGNWRALPELPASVLTVWQDLAGDEKPRHSKRPTGPGTSADVLDFVRRLELAGCKPHRVGVSVRAYCPNHGGQSGTTLKVDEGADGKALAHCKAGCTHAQVVAGLPARDMGVETIGIMQQARRAKDARKAANDPAPAAILPAFPDELLQLPCGLGEIQAWILGFMTYPSPAAAGVAAIATLAHFAMQGVRIESRRGLGLNEQFLVLAPTGFGKEDLRTPFELLSKALPTCRPANAGNLWPHDLPRLQYSAPASQQGLHKLLEAHSAQTFLADEFAEWLGHAASDSHKQQALGHIMQAYSKAFGTLAAPAAVTQEYKPVENPRVLIFATSTAERILETINASHADSGALNRFVIFVAEQDHIAKRYDVSSVQYLPPRHVVELVAWVSALRDESITFDEDAHQLYIDHDGAVLDPLKFADTRLAGRLNEQAFKLAALIALGDRRTQITVRDLVIAYAVREGLYHRAASLIRVDGALSGMHTTGRALEQLRQHLTEKPFLYRSNLTKVSRQFGKLSLPEREAVIRAVQAEGYGRLDGGRFVSLIHEEAA